MSQSNIFVDITMYQMFLYSLAWAILGFWNCNSRCVGENRGFVSHNSDVHTPDVRILQGGPVTLFFRARLLLAAIAGTWRRRPARAYVLQFSSRCTGIATWPYAGLARRVVMMMIWLLVQDENRSWSSFYAGQHGQSSFYLEKARSTQECFGINGKHPNTISSISTAEEEKLILTLYRSHGKRISGYDILAMVHKPFQGQSS